MPVKRLDALLELGVEPIPSRFMPGALEQLKAAAEGALEEARLSGAKVRVLGTYRRLAVLVEGLPARSEPLVRRVQGPPAKLLRDETGAFSKQAVGFAKAQGTTPEKLGTTPSPRGELLVAETVVPGEAAAKLVGPLFKGLAESLRFPKTMRWEPSGFRFARPIRWVTALLGGKVVPLELAGVRSGRVSFGPQELKPQPLALAAPAKYLSVLRSRDVLADPAERREALLAGLRKAAAAEGLDLPDEPALVEEVLDMVEHPSAVTGSFRESFLELPAPLILTTLKKHLRAFPLLKDGRPRARFVMVRDGASENQKLVRQGYERVVEARLDDAVFYYGRDRKSSLEAMREKLAGVLFHRDLGSMKDKGERVAKLASGLCAQLRQDRDLDERAAGQIAGLCYADLASDVVGEFPELQGRMGGAYARLAGLPEKVAMGLEEFYRPEAAGSPLPVSLEAALASLAGKLDTLAGHFAVGQQPTGSADPHGLRRQALGAWRILLEKGLPVDLERALAEAAALQPAKADPAKAASELSEFLIQRAEVFLQERGYPVDELRAVREGALRNVPGTVQRLAALHSVRGQAEFAALAAAYKRAANILKQAGVDGRELPVDRAKLQEQAELALWEDLNRVEGEVSERLSEGDYEGGLRRLTGLKPSVDGFFEKVLVMADDEGTKLNRIGLLARLVRLFKSVADLSQLQ